MLTQVSERCFLTCGYLVLIFREGARPEPDIERHIVGVVGMLQRLSSKQSESGRSQKVKWYRERPFRAVYPERAISCNIYEW